MSALNEVFESPNVWLGIGVALVVPVILPLVGGVIRPVAKTAIKGYLAAVGTTTALTKGTVDRIGEVVTSMREEVGDIVAEARHEYETGSGWLSRAGHTVATEKQ